MRWSSPGYLCCRLACSIQLKESVIITGGFNISAEPLKRVQQYNLTGSMGRLPDMNTARSGHACGHYIQNGNAVSTNKYTVQPGRVTTLEEIPGKPDMSSLHYFFNDQLSLSDFQIYVRDQDNTESDRLS